MRAAVEAELSVTARRVVKVATAAGWYVVAVKSSGATPGQVEAVLTVAGVRGAGRFLVEFLGGSVDAVYWWTREHVGVDKGYRREDVWVKTRYQGRVWYPGTRVESLEPRLKRDESLDTEVRWTTSMPVRTKLSTLAELVGVAGGKNPRRGLLESERAQASLLDAEPTQE